MEEHVKYEDVDVYFENINSCHLMRMMIDEYEKIAYPQGPRFENPKPICIKGVKNMLVVKSKVAPKEETKVAQSKEEPQIAPADNIIHKFLLHKPDPAAPAPTFSKEDFEKFDARLSNTRFIKWYKCGKSTVRGAIHKAVGEKYGYAPFAVYEEMEKITDRAAYLRSASERQQEYEAAKREVAEYNSSINSLNARIAWFKWDEFIIFEGAKYGIPHASWKNGRLICNVRDCGTAMRCYDHENVRCLAGEERLTAHNLPTLVYYVCCKCNYNIDEYEVRA